jgi:hypothetical protein
MRDPVRRRKVWASIAAGAVALLLVLFVVVATHDPRPDLTRMTIHILQWSLQNQNVK